MLSEHRYNTSERPHQVRIYLREIPDIPPLTGVKNRCLWLCKNDLKECSLRLWSPCFSWLLLFPYLFPVKNVHVEWFSFGKCDLAELRHSMVMRSFSRRLKNKQTGLQAELESYGCLDLESRTIKDKLKCSKLAWSRMLKIQPYKRNGNFDLWSFILNKAIFEGVENSLLKNLSLLPLIPEWMTCNDLLCPSTLPWYW